MKKIVFFFILALLPVALFASSTEVFRHTPNCGIDQDAATRIFSTDNFTIVLKKASSNQMPADTLPDLRVFKYNSLTITANQNVGNIDSVKINITPTKCTVESLTDADIQVVSGQGAIVTKPISDTCAAFIAAGSLTSFTIVMSVTQVRINSIEFYWSDKASNVPIINSVSEIDFGSLVVGQETSQTIQVEAYNLSADIVVEPAKTEVFSWTSELTRNGGSIEVTFSAQQKGEYAETMVISSGAVSHSISVKGKAVDANSDADGSKENPFSVDDVIALDNALQGNYWVEGYIWGVVKSTNKLQDTFKDDNSIALGATREFDSTAERLDFVPVQVTKDFRDALGLMSNPSNIYRKIKVYGSLEPYFTMTGVKNIAAYEWLDGDNGLEQVAEIEGIRYIDGWIINENNQSIRVINMLGQTIALSSQNIDMRPMSKGIYVVVNGSQAMKINR